MSQQFLATDSPYVYVWHDNGGQNTPDNTKYITCKLSTAGMEINIAANTKLAAPLIIINSASKINQSINTINIGSRASVQVIEYLLADDENSENHVHTTINCGAEAQLQHCILQQSKNAATILQESQTFITQQRNSMVTSNSFAFGGSKNILKLNIALCEAAAECKAAYLAYTIGNEKHDAAMTIEHKHPHCTSSSVARGVLKDKSCTDFLGKIIVHSGAVKTAADLQIKNLLCSSQAQAINKPELEIYNDDVRCSHGSSTGQINQDALFYMMSRGIEREIALAMLITGFVQPAISSCAIPQIVKYVNEVIGAR